MSLKPLSARVFEVVEVSASHQEAIKLFCLCGGRLSVGRCLPLHVVRVHVVWVHFGRHGCKATQVNLMTLKVSCR